MRDLSRRFVLGATLLAVIGSLLLLPGLGRITMKREQELRVALTARFMAQGGSWILPEFLDQPRLRKPPLMYWIVATAYLLADHTYSAAVARLPGATAGIALLLAIYLAGSRLIGRRRAFASALACATTFIFLRHARLGETDITLTLLTMLATLAGYGAMTQADRALRWWTLAGLAAGLGFLIKGPAALAIPLLTWLVFALQKPRRLKSLFSIRVMPGILLCAALAVPWYAAIFHLTRADSVAAQQLTRELSATFADSHHPGPIVYYVYTLLHALLPWSLLFPFAVWNAFKYRHHRGVRFLVTWFAVAFTCLSAIDSKQIHYTTLLLPQSALIIGLYAAPPRYRSVLRRHARIRKGLGIAMAILAGAGVGLVIAPWAGAQLPAVPSLALGFCMIVPAALLALRRESPHAAWVLYAAQIAVAVASYAFLLHPLKERMTIVKPFMESARPALVAARHVYATGPHVAFLEFYAGRDVTGAESMQAAWAAAKHGDLVLASGTRKNPVTDASLPAPPLLDLSRDGFRCVLLMKSSNDTP